MKFTKSQNADIQRTVKNFNQRLKRLESYGLTNLPEHVSVKELKETFATQRDLNRRLKQLEKFTARSAKNMVRVGKDRIKMSEWQRDVFYANRKLAKRRIEREIGDYQQAIARRISRKAPVQGLRNETLKNKLDELDYLTRDISSLTKGQLRTALATSEKEVNRFKRDSTFYSNFFDMMFKDTQITGLKDNRIEEIKSKLSQLEPNQLLMAYNAEPSLKHFVEYYNAKDLSKIKSEADESEISKMNTNIDYLLEKVDKIVDEFKDK